MHPPTDLRAPPVDEIEHQRTVRVDRRVQRRPWSPGLETNACHPVPGVLVVWRGTGTLLHVRMWRVALKPCDEHLHPLDRRVDVSSSTSAADFLAEHVPRFDRATQFQSHVAKFDFADERETELEERLEPGDIEVDLVASQIGYDVVDVGAHVPRQQVAIVEIGAPTHQPTGIRIVPETGDDGSHEQRLHQGHLRMRRHLERPQLDDAQSSPLAVWTEEFVDAELGPMGVAGEVDEQVSQEAVDQPRRHIGALPFAARRRRSRVRSTVSTRPSSTRGAWLVGPMNCPENR